MNRIDARSKSISQLLEKTKYSIDYYQREYKWKREHVTALLDDLETKFLSEYEEGHEPRKVQEYAHYFLGPIIISRKNSTNSIVDGQQRLTTLTLLLIYLNKTCFNGIFRVNKKGEYNVPYGLQEPPLLPSLDQLRSVSAALKPDKCAPPSRCGILLVKQKTLSW